MKRTRTAPRIIGITLLVAALFGAMDRATVTGAPSPAAGNRIIVYYFHGEFRCHTCMQIEQLTKKAVAEGFKREVAGSKIRLRLVNVDRPENRHYVTDYGLETKSVIIAEYDGQRQIRWKNLAGIWDYHTDETAFIAYVQREIKKYL